MQKNVQLVECPRDAMQGWPHFIATEQKIAYLNELLKVGFHTLDFGSFVSPKAIPQMADTKLVLNKLDLSNTTTKLLAIIANVRGAEDAMAFEQISYVGFPFSISPTFQQRNTNTTIETSLDNVATIQKLCAQHGKQLVVYISMGFGNPYGDPYNTDIVMQRTQQIADLGVSIISIADTVGLATATEVNSLMQNIIPAFKDIEIGVHLHAKPIDRVAKIEAALQAGCTRFDAALKGIGGCPMAGNDLVGNMDTEVMLQYFKEKGFNLSIDEKQLQTCSAMAQSIFI